MDEACLKVYIAEKYGFDPSNKLTTAVMSVSNNRRFHPIQEYLESLPDWDGIERIDSLLINYFAAEATPYVKAVMRKTLVAAIARIYEPGCQFDTMLILVGKQGLGKSTFFAKLAGEWFTDSLTLGDVKDKTAAEKLQGNWIVEMPEMVGFSRAESEDVKAFLSRRNDEYRVAYDKYCSEHPRQCIIVGSTNKVEGFLKDTTGNRRYWPVNVYPGAEFSPFALTEAEISQIWAEALVYYKNGEKLYLDCELEQAATNAFPTTAVTVYENKADAASIPTMYVGISESAWNAAENGTYTATVTFNFSSEEVEAPAAVTAADALTTDAMYKLKLNNVDIQYSFTYKKTVGGFEVVEILQDGEDVVETNKLINHFFTLVNLISVSIYVKLPSLPEEKLQTRIVWL